MQKIYLQQTGESHGIGTFLKILNFPVNNIRKFKLKQNYFQFVEQNKDKIQWYIDNYERLEEEYFERKHKERHTL